MVMWRKLCTVAAGGSVVVFRCGFSVAWKRGLKKLMVVIYKQTVSGSIRSERGCISDSLADVYILEEPVRRRNMFLAHAIL
jgi:hypothetical protein